MTTLQTPNVNVGESGRTLKDLENELLAGGARFVPTQPRSSETFTLPITDAAGAEVGTQDIVIGVERQRTSNGFVLVYNTRTGEPIPMDVNRLEDELRK